MAAEAEVELGNLEKAREYVNLVRTRAAKPDGFVMNGGVPAANYVINTYAATWADQTLARNAVRFERKLELSGEGHRLFDLVRWGVAETTLNAYLTYERPKYLPLHLWELFLKKVNQNISQYLNWKWIYRRGL